MTGLWSSSSSSSSSPDNSYYARFKRHLSHLTTLPPSTIDVLVPSVLTSASTLLAIYIYRNHLKRYPTSASLPPHFFRKKSLWGKVVAVGDADNFRLFHTPGGKYMGWGWFPGRRIPSSQKALKGRTIHVRIAGVDAPEMSHFGKPAQPYSDESLAFLTGLLLNRWVRASIYRRDQYERIVCSVRIRRRGILGSVLNLKEDVGLAMLRAGSAQVYESKIGVEFGKDGMEEKYRAAEEVARKNKVGMWAKKKGVVFESPGQYKQRLREAGG